MDAGRQHLQHRAEVAGRLAQGHVAEDQLSPRPLLPALAAAGLEPWPVPLLGQPGSPFLAGYAVVLGRTEIVFRQLDLDTLLLVRVLRTGSAPGLGSPLQGIARFVGLLARTRAETGLRRVVGIVNTSPHRSLGGLDDARLAAFYQRLHGARRLGPEDLTALSDLDRQAAGKPGTMWVGLDLDRFKGTRPRG